MTLLAGGTATPVPNRNVREQEGDNFIDLCIFNFLVYYHYGLTYDVVLIVDPETPITRKEYERTSEKQAKNEAKQKKVARKFGTFRISSYLCTQKIVLCS